MIPPVSASAATRMPADRSRAYRYDANAASGAAASRWKKLSARTSETLRRKYSRSWEGVAFSAGRFVVASRSPNSSPHAKSATATAPEAAHTPSTRADIASALTSLFTDPFQHARRSPLPVAAPQFRSPPKADTPTAGTASLRLARGSHDMGADPGDARFPNRTQPATTAWARCPRENASRSGRARLRTCSSPEGEPRSPIVDADPLHMHHRPQAASSRRPARLWVARG